MSKLIDKLLAQLPVMGPHAGIEAELLAAGRKPLGWVSVNDMQSDLSGFPEALIAKENADIVMLDALVEKGQLISKDVEVYDDANRVLGRYRHYAQSNNEDNLSFCHAFNQKSFNQKDLSSPCLQTDISAGTMLGYRKRDQILFETILPSLHVPAFIKKALAAANPAIREAYQRDLLRQIAADDGGIDAAGVDHLSQFTKAVSAEEEKGVDNPETQSSPQAEARYDTTTFRSPK